MQETTTDSLFDGGLTLRQPRQGYRFSIDALLLAAQVRSGSARRLVDLGAGCGVVSLISAYRDPNVRGWAVEIQAELAELARQNAAANGMGDRISVLHMDLKDLRIETVGGAVDLVVSNPPFRRDRSGRINPHPQRAVARHEIRATLADVAGAARRLLRLGGRFLTIYPADRLTDLLVRMRASDLEPKSLRMVHSKAGGEGRLVLAEGIRGGGPALRVSAPLILYGPDGRYTEEAAGLLFRP